MMSEETATLLIVDDEEMVLTSLSAFLMLETDYNVETFTSANAAIEFAEGNRFDLVISDYLMPEMDGISLLGRLKEILPESPRILLTGYADKENAIKGINEVGLFQYIEKPWDNEQLRLVIRNGLEKQQLLSQLQQKIGEINQAYGDLQSIQKEILKTFA
jgi:DNA-binding NtrC family response regulator